MRMEIIGVLGRLVRGETLAAGEAGDVFHALLAGELDPAQVGALLALVQARGVTVDELVGAATAMRAHVTRVPAPELGSPFVILDTCGTGGAPKTFNVSTAAAIIAAAAGEHVSPRVLVAKHGNRSRTGRGSAEVLAALGVNVEASPEAQSRCLAGAGVCFSFAIHHHPAMRHAAAPRRALGFPTIFNLLGPLTNPAGASRQLLGVYDAALAARVAAALHRLGTDLAMVVHSEDGLDEISLGAPTTAFIATRAGVERRTIEPASLGMPRVPAAALEAGSAEESAAIITRILAGEPGPRADLAIVNAGAALLVSGAAATLEEGVELARRAVREGLARRTLARLVEESSRPVV